MYHSSQVLSFMFAGSGCLLASCSQDFFIRLWKFSRTDHTLLTDPDELTMSEKKFTTRGFDGNEVEYSISLESVLIGMWNSNKTSIRPNYMSYQQNNFDVKIMFLSLFFCL